MFPYPEFLLLMGSWCRAAAARGNWKVQDVFSRAQRPLVLWLFILPFRYNIPALVEGDQIVMRNQKEEHADSVNLQGPLTVPLGLLTF